MKYGRMFRSVALMALIAVVGVALSACGGGAGGSSGTKNSQDLFLKKMLLIDKLENTDITKPGPPTYRDIGGDGTTNAYRDSKILMIFNTAVDFDTVNNRTIKIGLPTGSNLLIEAQGRFEPVAKKPNWVLFNPTYKTEYDAANPDREPDNPFGMDGNAVYSIDIPSVSVTDAKKYVMNRAGDPMAKSYLGAFATSNEYIQTYSQPEIVKTNPLNGAIEVDATSDVDMTFSEPMKPSSFRLADTIIIRNLDTGRNVIGTLRFSADAKTVSFRPVFGYGPGPYDIFVRVKTDVTNLSGNHIPKEVRIQFRTEYNPDVATLIDLREDFETRDYEDTSFDSIEPLADWNKGATSGYLAGLYATGTSTFKTTTTYLYPPWAWGLNFAGHTQTIWHASEFATSPRTLTGFDWYYQASGQAATVTNLSINLGHHEPGPNGTSPVTTNFGKNFKDSPVSVVSNLASYTIPLNTATGSWLTGPTFSKGFKYNGQDNLLFELYVTTDVNGLTNRIINGAWGFAYGTMMRTVWTQPTWWSTLSPATFNYAFDIRFYWLVSSAEAQSLFYDSSVNSPTFLSTLINPSIAEQPAGTSTTIVYQGARDDPDDPGTADIESVSEWFEDLEKLSGYRYIRFNVLMYSNLTTGQAPLYDDITFPYYFF